MLGSAQPVAVSIQILVLSLTLLLGYSPDIPPIATVKTGEVGLKPWLLMKPILTTIQIRFSKSNASVRFLLTLVFHSKVDFQCASRLDGCPNW